MGEGNPELVSVVVPVFNEEATLPEFHRRLSAALGTTPHEIWLVDDGSTDSTPRLLEALAAQDPTVHVLRLSRNFGHQPALTAGLEHASGAAVVTIDADLQDPPEVIPQLIARWHDGADVVHGVRRQRAGEPRLRLLAISAFYRLLTRLTSLQDYPGNTGDFRLLSRRALTALHSLPESNRFLRGLVRWVGFRQDVVEYDRHERYAGESKYPFRKLLQLALDGLLSFSVVPLRIASIAGLVVSLIAWILVPVIVVLRLLGIYEPTGIASAMILILVVGGLQLVCLGAVGEYVGRIYDETKRRPIYIVGEVLTPKPVPADGPGG